MVVRGHVWLCVVMEGGERSCMVAQGHTLVVNGGHAWSYMAVVTSRATSPSPQPGAGPSAEDTRMLPAPGCHATDDQKRDPAFRRVYPEPGLAIDRGETPHPPEQPRINLCLAEGR